MTEFFKKIGNQTVIKYCMEAENERGNGNEDFVYYRFLYQAEPRLSKIYWKGKEYTEAEFARAMILEPLWKCNSIYDSKTVEANLDSIKEIQNNKLLSIYYGRKNTSNLYYELACRFESCRDYKSRDAVYTYFTMAYEMSGMRMFRLQDKIFSSLDEFKDYINIILDRDINEYFKICDILYDRDVQTDFYCWMKSLGLEHKVSQLAMR